MTNNEEVISAEKRERKGKVHSFQATPEVEKILANLKQERGNLALCINNAILHHYKWFQAGQPKGITEEDFISLRERVSVLEARVDTHKEGFDYHEERLDALEGVE